MLLFFIADNWSLKPQLEDNTSVR